jgi:glycerophosphoryl diester phosphodiesterase
MFYCQKSALFILLLTTACTSNQNNNIMTTNTPSAKVIDWQGHRGARGILPENTIPSFIKALEYDIKTLELDVVVSKDKQIIVSHEPWFSEHICTKPNGEPVTEAEAKSLNIYQLTYEEIKTYDCGMRGHVRFAEQQPMKVFKPSFMEMVSNVELHCKKNNRPLPIITWKSKQNRNITMSTPRHQKNSSV